MFATRVLWGLLVACDVFTTHVRTVCWSLTCAVVGQGYSIVGVVAAMISACLFGFMPVGVARRAFALAGGVFLMQLSLHHLWLLVALHGLLPYVPPTVSLLVAATSQPPPPPFFLFSCIDVPCSINQVVLSSRNGVMVVLDMASNSCAGLDRAGDLCLLRVQSVLGPHSTRRPWFCSHRVCHWRPYVRYNEGIVTRVQPARWKCVGAGCYEGGAHKHPLRA